MLFQKMNMAAACLVAGVGYIALDYSFRWRRYNATHAKYGSKIHDLTVEEAQEIFHVAWCWDMPLLSHYSLASTLFKTYAIVSIFLNFNESWLTDREYSHPYPRFSSQQRSGKHWKLYQSVTLMYVSSYRVSPGLTCGSHMIMIGEDACCQLRRNR